jgi:hypothetical protein
MGFSSLQGYVLRLKGQSQCLRIVDLLKPLTSLYKSTNEGPAKSARVTIAAAGAEVSRIWLQKTKRLQILSSSIFKTKRAPLSNHFCILLCAGYKRGSQLRALRNRQLRRSHESTKQQLWHKSYGSASSKVGLIRVRRSDV